jgi:hypothetical protein
MTPSSQNNPSFSRFTIQGTIGRKQAGRSLDSKTSEKLASCGSGLSPATEKYLAASYYMIKHVVTALRTSTQYGSLE